MAIIHIDNVPYEVKTGKNLLEVCLSLGLDLPYFCWHPAMGSVGACRQCAVKVFKDEQDTKGRLVMACMEAVKEDLHLSINDGTARAFRAQVIEWLMTNHPHDCAVCDEGGSCHLQDMTVMTGHAYRRFKYKKRTYNNQYLGPFINHEMNRCIQCYRCVRFYKDYAGGTDLDVFAAHNHVYFGRAGDGVLESEFSGNLAEVCPTGVFTDKTLKEHYTRKWDLTMSPSICQHCSLGCNIIGGERYGELRQITNRYNGVVNGYFICDRGRFGYEFVNSENRIKQPLIRERIPQAANHLELYSYLLNILSGKLIGIGSPRASLESNFALRELVGPDNFFQGVSEETAELMDTVLAVYNSGDVHIPSLKEAESADVVLVLGEDLTNSAPMLALAVRQAVRNTPLENADKIKIPEWQDAARREIAQQDRGECLIAYPVKTRLDDVASQIHNLPPDDIARFAYAIANLLDGRSAAVKDQDENELRLAGNIADILKKAKNPLVIAGTSLFNPSIIKAAAGIASALGTKAKKAMLSLVVPECNSLGLAMMKAPSLKNAAGISAKRNADTLIILENDLYRNAEKREIDELISAFRQIIVIDHLNNQTTEKANVLIPAGTFAETDGTLVNNEGRAQCFFQVFVPENENIRESWRWLDEFNQLRQGKTAFDPVNPNILIGKLVHEMPQFAGAESAIPPANLRIKDQQVPREPHRYSGRTAMHARENVSEEKPPVDHDTPLSFTMEGFRGIPPAPLTPFFWAPGWNSGQSVNKYQTEIGGPLIGGDPGVRLLNKVNGGQANYSDNIPAAFHPSQGTWLLIPLPHIFGSEELSMYSPGIAERAPKPYIAICKQDADTLSVLEGEMLKVKIESAEHNLPVRILEGLCPGTAGLPYNLNEMAGIKWPAKGTLTNGVIWRAPYIIS